MLKEKENVIGARLNGLKKDKKIIPSEKGVHKAAPYAIDDFLKMLESEKSGR